MKRIFIWVFFLASSTVQAQQWGGSPTILDGIYRNGYVNIEGLYISRYGSPLAGDANPFTLFSSSDLNQDHELTVFGSGSQKLDFRLYDGDLKIGAYGNPNAAIYNNGSAFFTNVNVETGARKVGLNTVIDGVASGGVLSLSRPGDGNKVVYVGASADDEPVFFGAGGSTEVRLVSGGGSSSGFGFYINTHVSQAFASRASLPSAVMKIDGNGNVGIGTTTPGSFKLAVNGKIWTQEVNVVMTNPGPDYVFEPDYDLTPLSEVESYIKANKHLPEVPSAKEMEKEGLNLKEMNLLLLRKIEELTLHLIEQQKEIAELKERSVSPDASGKKVEELTLHLIESEKANREQDREINRLKEKIEKMSK